ncbi:MAG: sigma-54-dependent Fis family transcriptional regulator [Burkholderiales bacterium]|nr:sigma-54-dependent Fis family transcriptional regulator [Burkholderiales bacterium]
MDQAIAVPHENLINFPFRSLDFAMPRAAVAVRPTTKTSYGAIHGMSRPMQRLYRTIDKVAPTDATVLIVGESGTGKELVANSIHQRSKRCEQVFIPINCGAVSPNLIEAELFGHERGSFTGANRMHKGFFERAAGGTVLLDEITEMAPELQVKLLRVLESGTFSRVGGDQEIKVKVRVIAATNRDPQAAVAAGQLREDLLYRLSVFPIEVPPLRERGDDVELLAQHFLGLLNDAEDDVDKRFSARALAALREHSWPGNVRELKNLVQRSFILADNVIELDGLLQQNAEIKVLPAAERGLRFEIGTPLAEAERQLICATLDYYDGNKKKAAEVLGLSLKTLYNRLNEYRTAHDYHSATRPADREAFG